MRYLTTFPHICFQSLKNITKLIWDGAGGSTVETIFPVYKLSGQTREQRSRGKTVSMISLKQTKQT